MSAYSIAIVVDAAQKSVADAVSVALGHAEPGSVTYVVGLSPTGEAPATHYGCHARAEDAFIGILTACKAGQGLPPVDWGAVGTSEGAVLDMCAALEFRTCAIEDHTSNFAALIGQMGLSEIVLGAQQQ